MPRGRQIQTTIRSDEHLITDAAQEFYKHNKVKGLSEATCKQYELYVETFIRWIGESAVLSDITAHTFEDFMLFKADAGNKQVSIATHMKHLRRFFKFCMERNYMNEMTIIIPKYECELKEPYTTEEMQKLLKRPISNNWVEWRSWAMVNYFFSTGQRLSTVLNIKVKDLDLDKGMVRLLWNKDKKQKYMPLSSALIHVLQEYIELSSLDADDYLFPEYEGKQLKKRSAESAIIIYNNRRGVTKTSIHLFRHTFAKNYILNGGNPAKLQKLLNHKTIDMTMKYVNLYGTDIASDLDLFNPLDSFKRAENKSTKRKYVSTKQ